MPTRPAVLRCANLLLRVLCSGSGIEPIGIGQNDLGPLSGGYVGGGGMIFDPLRQGGQAQIGGTGEVGGPDFLPR